MEESEGFRGNSKHSGWMFRIESDLDRDMEGSEKFLDGQLKK